MIRVTRVPLDRQSAVRGVHGDFRRAPSAAALYSLLSTLPFSRPPSGRGAAACASSASSAASVSAAMCVHMSSGGTRRSAGLVEGGERQPHEGREQCPSCRAPYARARVLRQVP